jgi:hypothetical protein
MPSRPTKLTRRSIGQSSQSTRRARTSHHITAAEDERHLPGGGHEFDGRLEVGAGGPGVARVHLHVAGVDHAEVDEAVGPQRHRRAHSVVRVVVGLAQGLGEIGHVGEGRRPAAV